MNQDTEVPEVSVESRIHAIWPGLILTPDDVFTYSWSNGSEKAELTHSSRPGGFTYYGVYHPDTVCEGGAVCKWCGRIIER